MTITELVGIKLDMEDININTLNTIFNRYKLSYRILNDDYIEIGGGNNIKYLKRYYFYIPIVIGSIIILFGFLLNFILFKFSGLPFIIYSIYGLIQINIAIKENRNSTKVINNEIKISENNSIKVLNTQNIKTYEIKLEHLENKMYLSKLLIIDKENYEHMFLTLIDDNLNILENNMLFIKNLIQSKVNSTFEN